MKKNEERTKFNDRKLPMKLINFLLLYMRQIVHYFNGISLKKSSQLLSSFSSTGPKESDGIAVEESREEREEAGLP